MSGPEASVVTLSEAAMRQAHGVLSGHPGELAPVLAATRSARDHGAVLWRLPVTDRTVHYIGSIAALAEDEGAGIEFAPEALAEREQAFLEDYRIYGPHGSGHDAGGSIAALRKAIPEAADAAWQMRPRAAGKPRDPRGGKAVIIGAYGGDHVGDTAILGGVLLRLHQEFGVTSADVLSHRPGHTGRLVKGLAVPVQVAVHDYTPGTIGESLENATLLAIAGGPMMDLPRVLAKHLATVGRARSLGIPFHIDRVGVGPFKRGVSRWAARRLFGEASSISLRTSGSGKDPTLTGRSFTVKRDPAFEYLATRRTLDRTTAARERAEDLLKGSEGRVLIGLNVRPIRHEWSVKGEAFSRSADARFFEELAEGMTRVAAQRPATFVFFPMNPIEFGKSDLAAAWRLHKLLGNAVDLRVWEADPDIDDVVWLLRRLDGALAMRFHAAIFALSQGLPTYGVDYYPGAGGKVQELFEDMGLAGAVRRIDTFDADWFTQNLGAARKGAA
jgi:polysaccharide pyruvyl transferase WcaK-like protein